MIAALFLAFAATVDPVAGFLNTYCISCHGEKTQIANRRFDGGTLSPADAIAIARRVESGTMPPKQAKQPGAAERQSFLTHLAKQAPNIFLR